MVSVKKPYIERFYSMVLSETDKMNDVEETLCISEGTPQTDKLPGRVTAMSLSDYVDYVGSMKFDLVVFIDTKEPSPKMVLLKHKLPLHLSRKGKIIYLGMSSNMIKLPYILSRHTISPEDTNIVLNTYVVA